jgi:fructose-1-phosphate kinase PfkB-like protein
MGIETDFSCVGVSQKAAEAVTAKDNGEWRMELPEPKIESEVGADYIPLLTALKLGK